MANRFLHTDPVNSDLVVNSLCTRTLKVTTSADLPELETLKLLNLSVKGEAHIYHGDVNTSPTLLFLGGAETNFKKALILADPQGSNGVNNLHFCINREDDNSNATIANSRMTIFNTGKVGIDNTTPTSMLDVTGDINTTDVYKVEDVEVLSGTTLGAGVINSFLLNVGNTLKVVATVPAVDSQENATFILQSRANSASVLRDNLWYFVANPVNNFGNSSLFIQNQQNGAGIVTYITISAFEVITANQNVSAEKNLLCTSTNIEDMFRVPAHGAPTTNAHSVGDMYIDTGDSNKLKICTVAGTPGTYVVVGSQS